MSYKETAQALVFSSPRDFLRSVGVLFEFRYVKDKRMTLEYRPILKDEWIRKAVTVSVPHFSVITDFQGNYRLLPDPEEGRGEEIQEVLDMHRYLLQLVSECTSLPPVKEPEELSGLRIYPPYQFKSENLEKFSKEPGAVGLRLGEGYSGTSVCGYYLRFNTWKQKVILPRKRKTDPEEPTPEVVGEETKCSKTETQSDICHECTL